jgi:hypothetical protein
MSGIAEGLFTTANAQYQTALKWRWLAILVLAFLEFFIVAPYVELGRAKQRAELELRYGAALAQSAKAFGAGLAEAGEQIRGRVRQRTDEIREELGCRFSSLNAAIAAARGETPPPRHVRAEAPRVQMSIPNMAMQAPLAAPDDPCAAAPPAFSAEQTRAIRAASRPEDLVRDLRPYVEQEIVLPSLRRFNREWREAEARPLADQVARLASSLSDAKQKAGAMPPGFAATWQALERAAAETGALIERIRLDEAAAAGTWWRTAQGKAVQMEIAFAAASGAIEDAMKPSRTAQESLAEIVDGQSRLLAQIQEKQTQKQKDLDELRASVAAAVTPAKWFAADLDDVAPRFTVLLGLALAVAMAWPASRLAELVAIARTSLRLDSGNEAMRFWLGTQSVRRGAAPAGLGSLALGAVLLLWIVFAAWQLSSENAFLQAMTGAIPIAAATLYDIHIRRALAVLAS